MYFIEKTRDYFFLKKFDYYLYIPILVLSIIGILVVKSAVMNRPDNGSKIFLVQTIGLVLGIILSLVLSKIDYRDLKIMIVIFHIFNIVLLCLVLVFGKGDELGSRSWLEIASFRFQPSEFTKISFILIMSMYLESLYETNTYNIEVLFKIFISAFVPLALVVAQKDFGTTMVFVGILFVMLIIYGMKYKYILYSFISGVVSLPIIWFFVLNGNRKERILVFLNPDRDPLGAGFNVLRSKMAIGSGQFWGKGIFEGVQNQYSAVPVKESDFIFSVIGEELGFIGSAFVILLFIIVIVKVLYVGINSQDLFGAFICAGISGMLGIHFIQNIGMTIGLLPVTGIPLPFISQGGSSLVSNFIAIGFVLSVSFRTQKVLFNHSML